MSQFAQSALAASTLWLIALTVTAAAFLLRSRRVIQDTTLVGPSRWMLGSLLVISGTQLLVAFVDRGSNEEASGWKTAILFAAAATSFCPLMSLLGAKRPQDRGWHFVVIALWAILVLPVAESLVLRHGQMPDLRGARSWFMLVLIVLGVVNSLPTRFWFPALLFGSGQLLMLASYLPMVREIVDDSQTLAGLSCCAIALIIATWLARHKRLLQGSLDVVWIDFRDSFGLLWGLRVAEQINIAARSSEWPLRLRWRGFVGIQGEPFDWNSLSDDTRKSLNQVVQNLLRRFVSSNWIAERVEEAVD
jgi:hypothetical protein